MNLIKTFQIQCVIQQHTTVPASWCKWRNSHSICTEWETATQSNPLIPSLNPIFNPLSRKSGNFSGCEQWMSKTTQPLYVGDVTPNATSYCPEAFSAGSQDSEVPLLHSPVVGLHAQLVNCWDYLLIHAHQQWDTKVWVTFSSVDFFLFMFKMLHFVFSLIKKFLLIMVWDYIVSFGQSKMTCN